MKLNAHRSWFFQLRQCGLAALLLCAALPTWAQDEAAESPYSDAKKIDRIVAIVDEDVILDSELQIAVDTIRDQIKARGSAMPPEDLLNKQVLERLIMKKLQVQRAETTGIRVSDSDVDSTLERVAAQNNITIAAMRGRLERDGFDFGEFRREMREELIVGRLRERVSASANSVTETEIEILLASERFGGGEVNVSQILISLPEGASPQVVQKARDEVNDLHKRIGEGLDFSAAAISYSDAEDALEGGLIGWRDTNTVPALFAEALDELEPGQVTAPIRTPAGFHLIKLNERRGNQQVMVNEVSAHHIMVSITELLTARDAMERIRELKQQIDDGADFAEIARDNSDDRNTANIGGDMGWFDPKQYGPRFEQILSSLQAGEVSEPFQTAEGWHLLKMNGERTEDVTELAIRSRAREVLAQQKGEEEYTRFLRQLRDESFVDIRDDKLKSDS
ncbi:MAG: peptidylprolyl isomerase [Xanthomonadales bacterium]|nr:peptidylprolyl isomerase [Xanthomonadales bacterium]